MPNPEFSSTDRASGGAMSPKLLLPQSDSESGSKLIPSFEISFDFTGTHESV